MCETIEENIAECLNNCMQNHVAPSIEEVNINNLRVSHTVQQSMMETLELQKDFVLMRNDRDTLT